MNHHNPYARIQEYFSLLSASMDYTDRSDNGISMQQICENTQIPAKIVRNDFLTIFQWQRSMNLVKNSDKNELAVLFYVLPIMAMEFAVGRASRKSITMSMMGRPMIKRNTT